MGSEGKVRGGVRVRGQRAGSDGGVRGRDEQYLVVLAKELHADHSEDEDDDGENEREVPQCTHGVTDDLDERVEGGPGASQLEHTQLREREREREREGGRERGRERDIKDLSVCLSDSLSVYVCLSV